MVFRHPNRTPLDFFRHVPLVFASEGYSDEQAGFFKILAWSFNVGDFPRLANEKNGIFGTGRNPAASPI